MVFYGGRKGSGGIFRRQIVGQFCIYKSRHLALELSNRVVGLPSLKVNINYPIRWP